MVLREVVAIFGDERVSITLELQCRCMLYSLLSSRQHAQVFHWREGREGAYLQLRSHQYFRVLHIWPVLLFSIAFYCLADTPSRQGAWKMLVSLPMGRLLIELCAKNFLDFPLIHFHCFRLLPQLKTYTTTWNRERGCFNLSKSIVKPFLSSGLRKNVPSSRTIGILIKAKGLYLFQQLAPH